MVVRLLRRLLRCPLSWGWYRSRTFLAKFKLWMRQISRDCSNDDADVIWRSLARWRVLIVPYWHHSWMEPSEQKHQLGWDNLCSSLMLIERCTLFPFVDLSKAYVLKIMDVEFIDIDIHVTLYKSDILKLSLNIASVCLFVLPIHSFTLIIFTVPLQEPYSKVLTASHG